MTETGASQPTDTDRLREAVERAHQEVVRLCSTPNGWRMSIPANPDRDSDLIIQAGLDAVLAALASVPSRPEAGLDLAGQAARARAELDALPPTSQPSWYRYRAALTTAPVRDGGLDLDALRAPTDSESADAPHNPDVWELRRRIDVLLDLLAAPVPSPTDEAAAAAPGALAAVHDVLDEYLCRHHGILTSHINGIDFLAWLGERGFTVRATAAVPSPSAPTGEGTDTP